MTLRTALLAMAILSIGAPSARATPIFAIAGDRASAVDVSSTPEGLSLVLWRDGGALLARTIAPGAQRGPAVQIVRTAGHHASLAYDEQSRRFAVAYPIHRPPPAESRTGLAWVDPAAGTVVGAGEVSRPGTTAVHIARHGSGFLLASDTRDRVVVQRLDAGLAPVGEPVPIDGSATGRQPVLAPDGLGQRVLVAWLSSEASGSLFAQVLDATTLAANGPPRALTPEGHADGTGVPSAVSVAWNPKASRWLVGWTPMTGENQGPEDDFAGSEITRTYAVVGQLVAADLATTPPRTGKLIWQQTDGLGPAVDVAVDAASGIGIIHTAGGFLALRPDGTRRRRGRVFAFKARSGDSAAVAAVPGTGSVLALVGGFGRFVGADEDPDASAPVVTTALSRVRSIPARPTLTLACDEPCEIRLRSVRVCLGRAKDQGSRRLTCDSRLGRARLVRSTGNTARTRHFLQLALTRAQRRALMRRGHAVRARRACIELVGRVGDFSGNVAPLFGDVSCFGRPQRRRR